MKTSDERTESIKNKVKIKRRNRSIIWTACSVACVFIALTVVCSLPILGEYAPDINAYKNDEYFPLIQKINERYQDNKISIFDKVTEDLDLEVTAPTAPAPDGTGNSKYEETTLNQVDGVIEADLLKRSTTHAFYLKNGYRTEKEPCLCLDVYNLDRGNTSKVAECFIEAKDDTSFSQYASYIDGELFLNDDATRVTVITNCISVQKIVYTVVISLDVSNVNNITEVNRVYISGEYLSSRKANGNLLVITNFNVGHYGYSYNYVDYGKKETYVPLCGDLNSSDLIPINDIYIPDNCPNTHYTVLAMLDETTLDVKSKYASFSFSQDVNVSNDYLFVMRNSVYYYDADKPFNYGSEISVDSVADRSKLLSVNVCEIVVLSYKNGFEKLGVVGLNGSVKDRYGMDEKDGILRVVTTINQRRGSSSQVSASLYCVDLATMKTIAQVNNFAPLGDEVKSVRFDGNKAYVCTAIRNTDPVYYFDLSDLNNIVYKDTGTIPGFSISLIKFGDKLLGIGENSGKLKIELYSETDSQDTENKIVSVAKYERNCGFSSEYKAHFIDSAHNLVGLHIFDYDEELVTNKPNANRNKYLLLRYNDASAEFETVFLDEFDCANDLTRAFCKDNGVYVFGTNGFEFIPV